MAAHQVYKFRDFSARSLEILKSCRLHFSKSSQLNDHLDITTSLGQILDKTIDDCPPTTDVNVAIRPIMLRGLKSIKYLHEPTGRLMTSYEVIDELLQKAGVLSLSCNVLDPLLWAHYADGHKGFALEFARDKMWGEAQRPLCWGSVNYSPEPTLQGAFIEIADTFAKMSSGLTKDKISSLRREVSKMQMQKLLLAALMEKSIDWKYEQEFRFVQPESGLYAFDPSALKSVTLGARTSSEDYSRVVEVLRRPELSHVAILKVKHRIGSYKFEQHSLESDGEA
jgi:hypothetical protein